jgi:flagellar biosynthesis/type III secretory pathway protein FliH
LSNLIVKDYKYVAQASSGAQRRGQVIRDEYFPDAILPIFKEREKKPVERQQKQSPLTFVDSATNAIVIETSRPFIEQTMAVSLDNQPECDSKSTIDEFDSRLKNETQAAFNRGLQEGRVQGAAEWTPRAKQISESFDKALEQLGGQFQHYCEELEKSITELSVHLAEKIVGEAAHKMPEVVKVNLDKCTSLLAGSGKVVVKINPSDYESIKTYLSAVSQKYEGKFAFQIEPDQNITSGGCIVELDGSMIDARIETQLTNIKNHMKLLT